MNQFITRVELHNANESDYERLHAAMTAEKFGRILKSGTTKYQLPTAMYVSHSSTLGAEGVRGLAKRAADTTGKTYWIITIQSNGMAWELPIVR